MRLSDLLNGTYVVAVSGGVDSVALLHALTQQNSEARFVVAHFNHGIRPDSKNDEFFVQQLAQRYGLSFELGSVNLGEGASEEQARNARYTFLRQCRENLDAVAIVTAHHQDDILETIVINCIRGTGWRGLSSLRSHPGLVRPLLEFSKKDILDYATKNQLDWHEDGTNNDQKYLRNYVRHTIMPSINQQPGARLRLIELWQAQAELHDKISSENATLLQKYAKSLNNSYELQRYVFIMLPFSVALELFQAVTYQLVGHRLERNQAVASLNFIKTAKPTKVFKPTKRVVIEAGVQSVIVGSAEIC